jgi:hypothetical protein
MLRQASRIARPLANSAAKVAQLAAPANAAAKGSFGRSVAKAFSTKLPNAGSAGSAGSASVLSARPFAPARQRQQQQQARLNSSLSRDSIRQTESFNHGLKTILALLSERGSWNYAEAWVPHESSQVMNCKATWADDTFTAVQDFREAAMSIQLRKGKGEAGRVWDSGAPSWVETLRFNGRARINGAEGAGLSSGMAVPILMGDEVMAVLHFYTTKPTAPSQDMMEDFSRHGTMLLAAQTDASMRPMLSPMATGSSGQAVMTQAKMDAIHDRVIELGAFERSTVYEDVDWFVNRLGLPRTYFERFGANEIARHVSAYISAKKLASVVDESTGDEMRNEIETTVQSPTSLVIMRPATREAICEVEMLIDEMRNRCRAEHRCLTTARFRTSNTAVPYGNCELMVWILDNEEYLNPDVDEYERDVNKLTSLGHQKRSKHIFPQFQELVNQKQDRLSPLITRGPAMDDGTVPVVVGLKSTADKELRSARGFNLLIAELLGHDLVVRRKYATTW